LNQLWLSLVISKHAAHKQRNEKGNRMIVCVCHNVSDRKIRQAVDQGASSMLDLRKQLSVGTCCGKCHSYAKDVLRNALDTSSQTVSFQLAIAA
jgi:bacterioferritin-associated ferredoxin